MIVKKLKRKSFRKPKAIMIGDLVDYIFASKDEHGEAKLLYGVGRNFLTGTLKAQKREMISLAQESVQSKMPVTHWMLSWQENEFPSQEQIDEAVQIFLERMGLGEHQVFYVLHGNTRNYHVHIVVNRTHPYTMKVVQPHRGFDIEETHRTVAVIEKKQGWASEAGARYRVDENGEIVRNAGKREAKPKPEAESFENATGEKSAQRIAQERGHAIIKNAQSWSDLHQGLEKVGLRFEKKGSGGIVFVGDTAVKASSVDRNFGLGKLCKRLGEFEPGDYAPEMPTPEAEPVSDIGIEEWREYCRLQAESVKRREEARKAAAAAVAETKSRHTPARHHTWLEERSPYLAMLLKYHRRLKPGMKRERPRFTKPSGSLASPYRAYREQAKKRFPEPMDNSRLDAVIALWMRVTGYSKAEAANEIYKQARPSRSEKRDWPAYVRGIARYAYGVAGDIDIDAFQPTPEKVLAFQQETEKLEAAFQREEEARRRESEARQEAPRFRMR